MNIKNMICAALMMSAACGNSVAIAGGPPSFEGLENVAVAAVVGFVGVGVGLVLGYQQGEADALVKQSLKTVAGGTAGGAVGAAAGFAAMVLGAALINALNNKR